jgi:hypothetical protein
MISNKNDFQNAPYYEEYVFVPDETFVTGQLGTITVDTVIGFVSQAK